MYYRALLPFLFFLYQTCYSQVEFYISPDGNDGSNGTLKAPLRSIEEANERIRAINKAERNIIVYLRGGIYYLESPVLFDASLSGKNGKKVIYKAYKNEKPVISGGTVIDNWTLHEDGIYKAHVGTLNFRQLYVDGKWATRARRPNNCNFNQLISWGADNVSPEIKRDVIEDVEKVKGVELIIQKHWNQSILRIEKVAYEEDKALIRPMWPEVSITFPNPPRQAEQYYHLENAYEFLDIPNEWYLDTKNQTLYYKPFSKDAVDELRFLVPRLENLFIIEGTPQAPVENLLFEGLTFEGTNWINPSLKGYVGIQAGVYAKENVGIHVLSVSQNKEQSLSAAVLVKNVRNLILENNTIKNMGGTGILLHSGVKKSQLSGNTLYNIAGNGIEIDWVLSTNVNKNLLCEDNLISNNFITHIGQSYYGSVAIFAGITKGTVIENNHIEQVPHAAISVGWSWNDEASQAKKNIIRDNYISHAMNMLSDGGAIYTLGRQDSTRIENNLIMNITRSAFAQNTPVAAIYLDQGSDYITVANNVFLWVDEQIHYSPNAGQHNLASGNSEDLYAIHQVGLVPKYTHILEQNISVNPSCSEESFSGSNQHLLLTKIFPNPASENFHIVLYNNDEVQSDILEVSLYNINGSRVMNKKINLTKNLTIKSYDIDIEAVISGGMYILQLIAGEYTSSTKILVKR